VAVNCAGESDSALVTEESLVGAADAQLYRAKNAGRNRVCTSAAPDVWGSSGRDAGQEGNVAFVQR
jgi:hypothetical protein